MIVGRAEVEIAAVTSKVRNQIREGFEKGTKGVGTEAGQEFDKEMSAEVDKSVDKTTTKMRKKFSKAGGDSGDAFGKSMMAKIEKHFSGASFKGKLLGGLTSFIGPAAGLISDLGGGITALAASISSAAGVTPILYSGILSVVSAMGAMKLASGGVGKAIKADLSGNTALYRKQLALLGPAQREFVRYIKTLQPEIKRMKQVAGENLFAGVTRGIKSATPVLPVITKNVGLLDRAIGGLVARIGALIGGPLRGQFTDILNNNSKVFTQLTYAVSSLFSAFIRVEHVMGPFQLQFAKLARTGAAWLDRVAKVNAANGSMAKYFQRAETRAKLLGSILHNIAATLRDVFHAAAPAGDSMLKSIDKVTKGWSDFAKSSRGQNDMRKYFRETVPVMKELAGIVGDAFKGMARLGGNSNLLPLLHQIRTELEPAIGRLLNTTSGPLASSLVTVATDLTNILGKLADAGASGYIQSFVETLDNLSKVLATILDIPGIGTLAGTLLGVAGAVSAVGLVAGKLKILKLLQGVMFPKGAGKLGGGGGAGGILGGLSNAKPVPVFVTNMGAGGLPGGGPGGAGKEVVKDVEKAGKVGVGARILEKSKIGARVAGRALGVIGFADLIAEALGPKLHSGGIATSFRLGQRNQDINRVRDLYAVNNRGTDWGKFYGMYNPKQAAALDRLRPQIAAGIKTATDSGMKDLGPLQAAFAKAQAAVKKYATTSEQGIRDLNRLLGVHVGHLKEVGRSHQDVTLMAQQSITKQSRFAREELVAVDRDQQKFSRKVRQSGDLITAVLGNIHSELDRNTKNTDILGAQILEGLIRGMKAKTKAAVFQAKLSAAAVFKQLHLSGEYGSPSRITTRYGRWTVDGLVKGMRERMPHAHRAAAALSQAIHSLNGAAGSVPGGVGLAGSGSDELRAMRMDMLKLINATERQTRSIDSVPHGIVHEQAKRGGPQWRSAELLAG